MHPLKEDQIPELLFLMTIGKNEDLEEMLHFIDFLVTPTNSWIPAALSDSAIRLSAFRMADQLFDWLFSFGNAEMPEWFKFKGGEAYVRRNQ